MTIRLLNAVVAASIAVVCTAVLAQSKDKSSWQQEFPISSCNMQTSGKNPYFILEPGFQLVLEGGGT